MAEILNKSGQLNYVAGNKIFILGPFKDETFAELLGNVSNMVDALPWRPVFSTSTLFKASENLENPYNLAPEYPDVIDIYINSNGGVIDNLNSLTSLLDLAKAKGAIIRTNVIGCAYSCASMLAVQGTPNFRIMYNNSYHGIHFGRSRIVAERQAEIDVKSQKIKQFHEHCAQIYLQNTKLTKKQLQSYYNTEGKDELAPRECLANGICDWIVLPNGIFMNAKTLTR